jgi:hypothetical protein
MLTDEVDAAPNQMNPTRLIASFALLAAPIAWPAERVTSPVESPPPVASPGSLAAPQVPLLFVVDGVRYPRGQQPPLSNDQIFAMRVIKGSAAIQRYGQDASYGVVLIITRQFGGPRA